MALVRISRQLLRDVAARIDSMRAHQHTLTVAPLHPSKIDALRAAVLEIVESETWGQHPDLRSKLPAQWKQRVPRVDVRFVASDGGISEEFQIEGPIHVPPYSSSYYIERTLELGRLPPETADKVRAYLEAKEAHKLKYDAVGSQVISFLESCKSLNDAVKKMPNILLYVPQEYKDQLEKKVERSGPGKSDEDDGPATTIDHDLIATVGVFGTINGA